MLNFTVKKYMVALISVFLITVIFMSLFSVAMSVTDINDSVSKTIMNCTKYFSAFLAGCFCAFGGKKRGFLTGGIAAFFYLIILYAAGILIFGLSLPDVSLPKQLVAGILCGSFGGIIGINLKK